jgi:uncharacterized protein (DUF697 family)
MEINEKEGTACLRVLVAVAKADGNVSAEEQGALESAIELLPGANDLKGMLGETIDVEKELLAIKSQSAKDYLWESANGMVLADSVASSEEQKLLDTLRTKLGISPEKVSLTKRLFAETKDTLLPSNIQAISDPVKRKKEINEDTLKYSVLAAVLGAFPIPGVAIATDIAVIGLQVKLVRDISRYWGHEMDKPAAKKLLAGFGLGTGARIAVTNLVKLVPIWGSVVGGTTSFASTYALGKVADKYFEKGQPADLKELKKELKAAEKEGKEVFAQQKDAIEAKKKSSETKLSDLNEQLKTGKLTQAEYDDQVAGLAN